MKPIRWSPHAQKNLADREIPSDEARKTLTNPELVEAAAPNRQILMRRYRDSRLEQEMLIRAVVEEKAQEQVVVTVYITSKIGKYMKGVAL